MPLSTRRHLREIRRAFLGEDKPTASAGVGRGDLGLDTCTARQRRFRALLALHLFNVHSRDIKHPDAACIRAAAGFLSYNMTVSPRYDQLVFIIPRAVENALGRLMDTPGDLSHGMPGLRIVAARSFHTYHLAHLPTGARMVLARHSGFHSEADIQRSGTRVDQWAKRNFPELGVPLDPGEQAALDEIPVMTAGAETLLAALVSRIDARDPGRSWAMGTWWSDPLHRPEPAEYRYGHETSLWGSDAEWELWWSGHPYPEDIVSCLTAATVGVRGAVASKQSRGWKITLDGSSLFLRYGAPRR